MSGSIKRSFAGRNIYSRAMGNNLANLIRKNYKMLTVDPDHTVAKATEDVVKCRSLTLDGFDQIYTCRAGSSSPPFPFATADDYYRWASSHNAINDIRIPYLAISAD